MLTTLPAAEDSASGDGGISAEERQARQIAAEIAEAKARGELLNDDAPRVVKSGAIEFDVPRGPYAICSPHLSRAGFNHTPVNGKAAFKPGWQTRRQPSPGWLHQHATCNIAIVCGLQLDGQTFVVCVDLDQRTGDFEKLAALEAELGELPETLTEESGRGDGSQHRYFRVPAGVEIGCPTLGGIKWKGRGGYVVCEPSVHPETGNAYAFQDVELKDLSLDLCTELPAAWCDALTTPAPAPTEGHTAGNGAGAGHPIEPYAQRALEAELARLATTREDRNHALNRAAFSLGQLVAGGGLPRDLVERELTYVASRLQHDDPKGLADIPGTIRSGLDSGTRKPRTADGKVGATVDTSGLLQGVKAGSGAAKRAPSFIDLADCWEGELSPPEFLIEGLLETNTLAELFGDPGGGKTFVAVDFSRAIGWAQPWHGREVELGPVFYICAESTRGLYRRFRAAAQTHGEPETNMVSICPVPMLLATEGGAHTAAAAVAEKVAELGGEVPSLIVVDTLARNFGGNENAQEDMAAFIHHLDTYLRIPYGACVLVVHHSGHGDKTRSRGSSALKAAIDAQFRADLDNGVLTLTHSRAKESELLEPMMFRLHSVEVTRVDGRPLLHTKSGAPVTSAALVPDRAAESAATMIERSKGIRGNQKKAFEALMQLDCAERERLIEKDLPPDGVRIAMADWQAATGIDPKRWSEVVTSLERRQLVELNGRNEAKVLRHPPPAD